jgi:HEAT repeat protein
MTTEPTLPPASNAASAEEKPKFPPHDALPTVEPPSATFLLQLFIIPLLIVSMIVMVWMMFSWLAHAGSDPREMVKEIQEGKGVRWQRAVTLASMLGHSNSQYAELRLDPDFAQQLGELLRKELARPISEARKGEDEEAVKVRYYLCRTLGQLENEAAIPPLLEAAVQERNAAEVNVRLGALEALAVIANKLGSERFLADGKALPVLLECSRAQDDATGSIDPAKPEYRPHGELRGVAAYVLGVLGTPAALDRLGVMVDDVYPTARYNAATGLARAGDPRAVPTLLEMLDPDNQTSALDERKVEDQNLRKVQVWKNGIEATRKFVEKNPTADRAKLIVALQELTKAEQQEVVDKKTKRVSKIPDRAREAIRKLAEETVNAISSK